MWHRKQATFAEKLFPAYLKGNITPLAIGDLELPGDARFAPFDVRRPFNPKYDPRFICVLD
jgi:hypothetical protein